MRPKIVLLTLAFAVGLVALAAIFKGVMSHKPAEVAPAANGGGQAVAKPGAVTTSPASSNSAAITEQLRTTEIEKQLDEIRGLVVEGQGNPAAASALAEKVTHPEAAVRSAALQAVVALNDTNVIPRLQEAEQVVENPREKVAIMDAIAYLNLPETIPDTPGTNQPAPLDPTRFRKPSTNGWQNRLPSRSGRRKGQAKSQSPGAPAPATAQPAPGQPAAQAPAPQDQAPAPDTQTAPPQ